jgi:hypothetical protein
MGLWLDTSDRDPGQTADDEATTTTDDDRSSTSDTVPATDRTVPSRPSSPSAFQCRPSP